ncbi:MAG: heme transporter ATP-binding protein [Microbacteriaceae bacterium]|nr:heme transporter ATP-binding protein [Microbacteriaceae bacterium]
MTTISVKHVAASLGGTRVLESVSLDVQEGEVLALVGPNGAGKSTLLAVLAGDLRPELGTVTIDGRDIRQLHQLELARLRSVLTQQNAVSFSFLVRQVVEMGRSPWERTPQADGDEAAIEDAMAATDVTGLDARHYTALSGGEKARVSLARVLAQQARTVLLDEPTASLDLRHQEDVMRNARELATAGAAVVVVLHDLSLAGAWADRVARLSEGRLVAQGPAREVLTAERVSEVYGLRVEIIEQQGRPVILPVRGTNSLTLKQ